jgi:hypothetical protein
MVKLRFRKGAIQNAACESAVSTIPRRPARFVTMLAGLAKSVGKWNNWLVESSPTVPLGRGALRNPFLIDAG